MTVGYETGELSLRWDMGAREKLCSGADPMGPRQFSRPQAPMGSLHSVYGWCPYSVLSTQDAVLTAFLNRHRSQNPVLVEKTRIVRPQRVSYAAHVVESFHLAAPDL